MQIKLYKVSDETNKLIKTLGTADTRTGTVRGDVDILRPSVLVEGDVIGSNYAYIADFDRYYYIEDRNVVRNGLTQLQLRVDVLMSWAADILKCPAVFDRSTNLVNAYLSDSEIRQQSYMQTVTRPFKGTLGMDTSFSFGATPEYIVILAG